MEAEVGRALPIVRGQSGEMSKVSTPHAWLLVLGLRCGECFRETDGASESAIRTQVQRAWSAEGKMAAFRDTDWWWQVARRERQYLPCPAMPGGNHVGITRRFTRRGKA